MGRQAPNGMPILTPGRHRRPRHGACLMEYTSVLAGERFSDSPRCTEPVLAALARAVNDYIGDEARQQLAPLAADLTVAAPVSDRVRHGIVRRCLLTALPFARHDREHVLLIALLGLERAAVGASRGFAPSMMSLETEAALIGHERAVANARAYLERLPISLREYRRRGAAMAVESAVATIAAAAPDADVVLRQLLQACLADCLDEVRAVETTVGPARASQ